MSDKEREQAKTYYQMMQMEKEDSLCKFCDNFISPFDEQQNNATML